MDAVRLLLHASWLSNMVLIGLLAHQIDVYVQCFRKMAQTGLMESYNKGVTS